jgi:AcrR family transcriptional regulator
MASHKRPAPEDAPRRDQPRRPGRPQDARLDDAIVKAALDTLAEVGYEGLSIEEVARRAGTAKTSVYRRWPTRDELTLDAVRQYLNTIAATLARRAPAQSLRADLIAHIEGLTAVLTRERISVLAGLLLALRTNRELAAMIRAALVQTEVSALRAIVDRAVARHEIAPPRLAPLIFHLIPGVLFTRWFVLDEPMDRAMATELVDDVLLPLVAGESPGRGVDRRARRSRRHA